MLPRVISPEKWLKWNISETSFLKGKFAINNTKVNCEKYLSKISMQIYTEISMMREHIEILHNKIKDSNCENYHCTVPYITTEETWNSIKRLKSGKSSGLDGISAELLKDGGEKAVILLTKLFNSLMGTGVVPQEYRKNKNSEYRRNIKQYQN